VFEKAQYGPGGRQIDVINDRYAGEALGFGCFTGQTQKVGLVKDLIGPKAKQEEIDAYLQRLELTNAAVHPWEPLRSLALESAARQQEDAEAKRVKAEADARFARLKAEAEATVAQRKAAQEEYDRKVAEVKAAAEKFARDKAAHEAEVAKAAAAQAEYQRQMEEHRRLLASGKFARPN
jgi:membrane protein involved in colicin uptake